MDTARTPEPFPKRGRENNPASDGTGSGARFAVPRRNDDIEYERRR